MTMEDTPGAVSRRRMPVEDDEGVSPVIGMILVLAISILGIASILYWGLPAIDEMKANVEHRSVQSQFQDLDSTLKELVAGTTEKTAKRWLPTINRGEIVVKNNTEPWVFAVDMAQTDTKNLAAYDFQWLNFADGNESFTLHNNATIALTGIQVKGYAVGAGASLSDLTLTLEGDANGVQNANVAMGVNATKNFIAYQSGTTTKLPLNGGPYFFRVYNGSTIVAQAWFMNTSRIDYSLHAGTTDKGVIENNGAIITNSGGSYAILNAPSIPPPTTTAGAHRFFARALVLNGSSGFAGDNQFNLLISLYSTSVLASLDCAAADHSDCVAAAKIYDYGTMRAPWYQYLTSASRGYGSIVQKTSPIDTTVTYLEDRQTFMGYTLIESALNLSG